MKAQNHWNNEAFWRLIAFALLLLMLFALSVGCRCPREIATADTVYIDKTQIEYRTQYDSVWLDRWHTIYMSGDTVYKQDSVALYKYLYKIDSIYLHDTAYVGHNEVQTVEVAKPLSTWRKIEIGGFWALLAVALGLGAWKIYRLYLKIKTGGLV